MSFPPSSSAPVALRLYSSRELESALESVAATLKDATTANWADRITALRKIQALIEGGAQHFDNFPALLKLLRDPLTAQVLDLRSSVVREACITISAMGQKIGDQFEPYVDHFMPSLFKLLGVSIAIIKESGNECIRSLLCSTPRLSKPIARVFDGCAAQTTALRLRCMEFVLLLLEVGNKHIATRFEGQLQSVLKQRLGDKNEEVRQKARQACCAYMGIANAANTWIEMELDEKTRRLVRQEQQAYEAMRNGLDAPQATPAIEEKEPLSPPLDSTPVPTIPAHAQHPRRSRSSLGGLEATTLLRAKSAARRRAAASEGAAAATTPLALTHTMTHQPILTPASPDKAPPHGASRRLSADIREELARTEPKFNLSKLSSDPHGDGVDLGYSGPVAGMSSSTRSASSASSVRGRSRASLPPGAGSALSATVAGVPVSAVHMQHHALAQSAPRPRAASSTRARSPLHNANGNATTTVPVAARTHARSASAARSRPNKPPSVVGSPGAATHPHTLHDPPLSTSQRTAAIMGLMDQAKDALWSKRVDAYQQIASLFSSDSSAPVVRLPELFLLSDKLIFTLKDGLMDVHHRVCAAVLTCISKMLVPDTAGGQWSLDEMRAMMDKILVDIFSMLSHSKLPIREQANTLLNQITQTFPIDTLLATLIGRSFDQVHATGPGVNHAKVKLGILEYMHYLIPMSGQYFRAISHASGAIDDDAGLAVNAPMRALLMRISPFLSSGSSSSASGDPKLRKLTLGIMHTLYITYADTFFPTLSCLPVPMNRLVRRTLVETMPDIEQRIAESERAANQQREARQNRELELSPRQYGINVPSSNTISASDYSLTHAEEPSSASDYYRAHHDARATSARTSLNEPIYGGSAAAAPPNAHAITLTDGRVHAHAAPSPPHDAYSPAGYEDAHQSALSRLYAQPQSHPTSDGVPASLDHSSGRTVGRVDLDSSGLSATVSEVRTLLQSLRVQSASESSLKLILQTLITTVDTRLTRSELLTHTADGSLVLDLIVLGLSQCTHEHVLIRKLVIGCFVSLYAQVGTTLFDHLSGVTPVMAKLVRIYCDKFESAQNKQAHD